MKATYAGDQTDGVEVDGVVVLPGDECEFPDGTVLSSAWLVDGVPQPPDDEPVPVDDPQEATE